MRSGRSTRHHAITAALFGGAAALAFGLAPGVDAQTVLDLPIRAPGIPTPVFSAEQKAAPRRPAPPAPPPADDGLSANGFYLEADELSRDVGSNTWTANGQVEARYQGRTLRANHVVYDAGRGVLTADGAAQLVNADGTVQTASHLVLDDKMRAGFARGFAAREGDDITLAADVAIRRSETVNELDRAIFTPCQVCTVKGDPKEPTWSIQASKVIQDRAHHVVYYRNAVIRVKGIPVFYTPFLSHPDPSAPRASGFLIPIVSAGGKRGLSIEQPYLWVISPSEELVLSPQVSTTVNPLLNVEWLKRFYSGLLDVRAGYTYERDFDANGHKFGSDQSRAYVLANGAFDLNQNWSWGFGAERASDPLIFQKYDVSDVDTPRGLFQDDSQRLTSQIYATRQDQSSYLSISAMSFQGLRQLGYNITENNRVFPTVAPLIEWRYDPKVDILGGRLRLTGDGVIITRDESPIDPSIQGPNTRRASVDANWLRTFTLANGLRIEPFLEARGDLYNVDHLSATDTADKTILRAMPSAGVELSWPLIRQGVGNTIVLEPIAQFVVSPDLKLNANIPNEDSQVFQFDETDLFSTDKFTGYDLYDGGARLNVGGRATIDWGDGLNARMVLGRVLRADNTNIFPQASGLNRSASDWVLSAETTPVAGLFLQARTLLTDSFNPVYQEYGVNFAYARASGYVRYIDDRTIPVTTIPTSVGLVSTGPQRDIEGAGEFFVTPHWGFSLVGIRDLQVNEWRQRDVGLVYKDDCIRVEVFYQHEDVIQGQLGKSDTVFVRLTLATLGDQGYTQAGVR